MPVRRRFQFNLRSAILLTLAYCIGFGVLKSAEFSTTSSLIAAALATLGAAAAFGLVWMIAGSLEDEGDH